MYKIFVFFILSLFCVASSFAAPCYGTKMPKEKTFFLGAQNHTIFYRSLENNSGKLRSMQNFLLLSYGVFDWLAIDLKGGAGNIKQHPQGSDEIDYPSSFNGGYGFRIKAYESGKIKLVCGFQHISVHPKTVYIGTTQHKAILDDWQASCLVSRDFRRFTPYIGTKLSRTDYIHRMDGNRKRWMSDLHESIGGVLGVDLPVTEKIWLTMEGQAFDGKAFSFSVNYSF
jgi:hypothetical protein